MSKKKVIGIYGLAFLIPVVIMLVISIVIGFYPFGSKSVFVMDMRDQYLGFYSSLRYLFRGDDSFFFSWSRSWGGNRAGLYAYYLASPASFLTVLFPLKQMSLAIGIMTIIKIGLCGISFFWFGRQLLGDRKNEILLLLSMGYALCSYNLVYSMCPMWLDAVIFLPLIIGALMRFLDGKSYGIGYFFALAATMLCSYYIGYMSCLFVVLFYIYYLSTHLHRDNIQHMIKQSILVFIGSVAAIGVTAPLLLPNVMSLLQRSEETETDWSWHADFKLGTFFSKFIPGYYDTINYYGLPSIYCGLVVIGLLVLFFVSKKIQVREKIGAAFVLISLFAAFYWNPINLVWHGFHAPCGFPYRYAFVFSFFILFLGCRAAKEYEWKPNRKMALVGILFVVEMLDLTFNGCMMLHGLDSEFHYATNDSYLYYLEHTKPLVDEIQETDSDFYRINQQFEFSKNDAMLLGYNGMTHYSSTYNDQVNALSKKLGIAQTWMWNSGYGATPIVNSLLSAKYILDTQPASDGYELIDANDAVNLYRNNNSVPIVYATQIDESFLDLSSAKPFVNQTNFINAITGKEQQYFDNIEYSTTENGKVDDVFETVYTFTAINNEPVYMYLDYQDASGGDVYVNDSWISSYFHQDVLRCICLGSFMKGQEVKVRCTLKVEDELSAPYIVTLNTEKLTATTAVLKKNGIQLEYHGNATIRGNIEVQENQKIMTSIPYDEGWQVYIDGEKVPTESFANTFLMLEAEPGIHQIEFRYVVPGLKIGIIICIVSFLLLGIYCVKVRR